MLKTKNIKVRITQILVIAISLTIFSCTGQGNEKTKSTQTTKKNEMGNEDHNHNNVVDYHSFAKPEVSKTTHLNLDINVNFEKHVINGTASYKLENSASAEQVIFDIHDLSIKGVSVDDSQVEFEIKEGNDYGQGLYIPISSSSKEVSITYETSANAEAVQWLDPKQTLGKKHPFLFTQGQAILTRSWIPVQDSPGIRITYDATIKVPADLLPVMSATNPQMKNDKGEYTFKMDRAIPPYLVALAIGDIEFKAIGPRTGVYAEIGMVDKSAEEFSDMEKMVVAAEGLYGEYVWERFDVIVLPPSFPFGGMENPRLTFATPTIVVGDKSLTSLIAHELAHSWSGNLVTNSTWDDFWLNEGFTVYFEYRIMEEIYGEDYANMLKLLGYQDLQTTLADPEMTKEDTHLKLNLKGRNPDDGMTDIAYEKGHLFLEMLENTFGREKFDLFLKSYFTSNSFQNMTTESFIKILEKDLIQKYDVGRDTRYKEWIYGPGLPDNCPVIKADQFDKVSNFYSEWNTDKIKLSDIPASKWSTHEWLHFLREIPNDLSIEKMKMLDDAYKLTASKNPEIQDVWYEKAIYTNYEPAYDAMATFLQTVGRRKFLTPLYKAMKNTGKIDLAKEIYSKARDQYHSVSTNTMDELLGWE